MKEFISNFAYYYLYGIFFLYCWMGVGAIIFLLVGLFCKIFRKNNPFFPPECTNDGMIEKNDARSITTQV